MRWADVHRPLVLIVGPTAVGKTEISLRLAEVLGAEIISSDSRLFYRGMDIGTAKPSPVEQARVAHHLIDVAEPDENWSLARFLAAARQVINQIHGRNRLPVLVGGTGQYVTAIVEDWDIPAQAPDHGLREVLERWGKSINPVELHRKLQQVDPAAAARIDPQNLRRTVRALEVMMLTGQRFSEQYQKLGSPYSRLMIGLSRPREELYRRIDTRIEDMFARGWVQEVEALLNAGYSPDLPSFASIGYREIAGMLQGGWSKEETMVLIKRKTRQFVRRQANWFCESDPRIHWFDANSVNVNDLVSLSANPNAWLPPTRIEDQNG